MELTLSQALWQTLAGRAINDTQPFRIEQLDSTHEQNNGMNSPTRSSC